MERQVVGKGRAHVSRQEQAPGLRALLRRMSGRERVLRGLSRTADAALPASPCSMQRLRAGRCEDERQGENGGERARKGREARKGSGHSHFRLANIETAPWTMNRNSPKKNNPSCLLAHERASLLNTIGAPVGFSGATMLMSALISKIPQTTLKRKTIQIAINLSRLCSVARPRYPVCLLRQCCGGGIRAWSLSSRSCPSK